VFERVFARGGVLSEGAAEAWNYFFCCPHEEQKTCDGFETFKVYAIEGDFGRAWKHYGKQIGVPRSYKKEYAVTRIYFGETQVIALGVPHRQKTRV
jgi:hypothetical protein